MSYEPMKLERRGASFRIFNSQVVLAGQTLPPRLTDGQTGPLGFADSETDQLEIAGIWGKVIREMSQGDQLAVTREFFIGADGQYIGVRMAVRNTGPQRIRLHTLAPLRVQGDANFKVAGGTMATWRVLRLSRHKSDVPGVFRPSRVDVDYKDAAFNSADITAGMGVQGDLDSKLNLRTIYAEPATFVKNDKRPEEPGLFLCVLGEQMHLTSFYLVPTDDNAAMKEFGVFCEFDGVALDPGQQRDTHWIMIYQGRNEAEVLDRFVELQERHLNVSPLKEKLNIFCSWYFYGREFLPEDLDENLKILKDRPMPLDVFIIDNGWIDAFGDWNANDKWPGGMAEAADKIRAAGLIPGIWTAPFTLMPKSRMVKEHPELIARKGSGEPATFGYVETDCCILDTTHPFSREYLGEYLGRLESWGYTYHKMDFVRAILVDDICFHDPHVNRAEAYRIGLQLIRESIGPDSYFQACGGLMGSGNVALADSIRLGADSLGAWEHYSGNRRGGTLVQIKQALVRNYMSRLIHTDPDSLMIRRRQDPFRIHAAAKHNHLSDGKFTDAEAFTLVVRQYLVGGYTDITERLAELPEDRRALLRHMIPAFAPPARILDMDRRNCPTLGLTEIVPRCDSLGKWRTLSVSNWDAEPVTRTLTLSEISLPPDRQYAVLEFRTQQFLGIKSLEDPIELEIPAHGTRVLRIAAWEGDPLIVGTDLHLSGGGCELAEVQVDKGSIRGKVVTKWDYPVRISAVFPGDDGPRVVSTTVTPPDEQFHLRPDR